MLAKYVEYADAVVGRYGVKPDGSRMPNVRTVARPLLNLFVGEPSGRKWRHLLDVALLKKPATISEVVQVPSLLTPVPTPVLLHCPSVFLAGMHFECTVLLCSCGKAQYCACSSMGRLMRLNE